MGMVVRSNIMALNANRQLGMNNSQVSKSLEKLSSGFKINRAGDDASGLAISEKMKAQIKGLETASANAQDGISLVQTAEGALTEVHDMLNRMVELAEKSANGTLENPEDADYDSADSKVAGTDRAALQEEMDALATEIDRIADSTNFNKIDLLNGKLSGKVAESLGITEVAGQEAKEATKQKYVIDLTGMDALRAPGSSVKIAGQEITLGQLGTAASLRDQVASLAVAIDTTTGSRLEGYTVSVSGTKITIEALDNKAGAVGGTKGPASGLTSSQLEIQWGKNAATTAAVAGSLTDDDITLANAGGKVKTEFVIDIGGLNGTLGTGATLSIQFGDSSAKVDLTSTAALTTGQIASELVGKSFTLNGQQFTITLAEANSTKLKITANNGGAIDGFDKNMNINFALQTSADPSTVNSGISLKIKDKSELGEVLYTAGADSSKASFQIDVSGISIAAITGGNVLKFKIGSGEFSINVDESNVTLGRDDIIAKVVEQHAGKTININGKDFTVSAEDNRLKFTSVDNLTGEGLSITGTFAVTGHFKESEGETIKIEEVTKGADATEAVGGSTKVNLKDTPKDGDSLQVGEKTYQFVKESKGGDDPNLVEIVMTDEMTKDQALAALQSAVKVNSTDYKVSNIAGDGDEKSFSITKTTASDKVPPEVAQTAGESSSVGLTLQIGDTNQEFNKLTVMIEDMHMDALFVGDMLKSSNGDLAELETAESGSKTLNISTQKNASAAVDAVKNVINTVSTQRAKLGAVQNRLEHTINNLDVAAENMSSANSRIRDTDMAKQMMDYTKMNVLTQAAQAMLAQANQQPQSVLQLLQ